MNDLKHLWNLVNLLKNEIKNIDCSFCTYKSKVKNLYKINHLKRDIDFQYVNEKQKPMFYEPILRKMVPTNMPLTGLYFCSNCYQRVLKEVKEKYTLAYSKLNTVDTFPSTYRSEIKINSTIKPKLKTYYFSGGKWNTLNKMRFWAAFQGYDVIYNITYDYGGKVQESNGSVLHKKPSVTGIFAKKS